LQVVTALAIRYLFYEDWEENCRLRRTYLEELERKVSCCFYLTNGISKAVSYTGTGIPVP
jgi:hypothetical protein